MGASLPLWMGTVPDYEIVAGQMQITLGDFILTTPINVFLCGCAKGKAAIMQWERSRNKDADIIPFRQEYVEPRN